MISPRWLPRHVWPLASVVGEHICAEDKRALRPPYGPSLCVWAVRRVHICHPGTLTGLSSRGGELLNLNVIPAWHDITAPEIELVPWTLRGPPQHPPTPPNTLPSSGRCCRHLPVRLSDMTRDRGQALKCIHGKISSSCPALCPDPARIRITHSLHFAVKWDEMKGERHP